VQPRRSTQAAYRDADSVPQGASPGLAKEQGGTGDGAAYTVRLRLNTRASERFGSRVFGGRVLGPVIELTPEEAREDV
jgi:hypothetical protein